MSSVASKDIKKMICDLHQEKDEYVVYMYFCDKREEYYIGRSKNMISRHGKHCRDRFGDFNFKILKRGISKEDIARVEMKYITTIDLPSVVGYILLNKLYFNMELFMIMRERNAKKNNITFFNFTEICKNIQKGLEEHERTHPNPVIYGEQNPVIYGESPTISQLTDEQFTEEYIKPYLAKCEFIEKTCKKNKTKYTRFTCLCKCVINFSSKSPCSYEKHILLPTHINIFQKFSHLIKDINLNPIPRDRQEISHFYR